MKRTVFIIFISLLFCQITQSQTFPLYSQYVSNGLLLNPAYAGSKDVLSVSMLYRKQWVGFSEAPLSEALSVHAPMRNRRVGLGLIVLHQKIGEAKNTQINLNYAYRMFINQSVLALGIRGGFKMAQFNFANIRTNEPDPSFLDSKDSYFLPSIGAGAYFNTKNYFAGFSIPNLLFEQTKSLGDKYSVASDIKQYEYLFTTGYLFDINKDFKIKASTLIKQNKYYKWQSDLNLTAITLNSRLWLGTSYRIKDAVVGIIECQISSEFRVGYSVDYSIGKLNKSNTTSHEFILCYDFNYKIKAFNPRYF